MLRIVADTNIYISAVLFGGLPEDLLIMAKAGQFDLYISPPIFEEIRRVFAVKFKASDIFIEATMEAIRATTHLVAPQPFPSIVVQKDPSDDRILECAAAVYAHVIVSGDDDLLELNHFGNTEIMNPRNFLDYLKLHGK